MIQDPENRFTKNLFLRCICAIYLFAFSSLYIQIPGLYGKNGILPAWAQLDIKKYDLQQQFEEKPTLLWFAPHLGLNTDYMMELIALVGTSLSLLGFISQIFCVKVTFTALWLMYFSLYQVGQVFMWFQWDILLLETGILCILLAPHWQGKSKQKYSHPPDSINMWLVRWLLFRLMFSSGVVKLTSGCPSWWNLSALKVHFQSMCIPTPLAWYSHHLPDWFLKFNTAFAIIAETALPFLFFFPLKQVRTVAFFIQIFLQLGIIFTGNFTFFNYLTIALCLSLLDDSFFYRTSGKGSSWAKTFAKFFITITVYGLVFYGAAVLFGFKLLPGGIIDSKISFTNRQVDLVLSKALPIVSLLGIVSLTLTAFFALGSALSQSTNSCITKLISVMSTLFYIIFASIILLDSMAPLSGLHPSANGTLPGVLKEWRLKFNHLQLTNSYGLFRKMTGVGGRHEVIIEGANDPKGPWHEYHFLYKPGMTNKSLPFVAPHQPRLDWQMWFAALGTYHQNPWLMSFVYRLLQGEKQVLDLMDQSNNPFPKAPPSYIRGTLFIYHYTPWKQRDSSVTWSRQKVDEYFPPLTKTNEGLVDFLKKLKVIPGPDKKEKLYQPLVQVLDKVRSLVKGIEPTQVVLSLFLTGLATIILGRLLPTGKPVTHQRPKQEKRRKK